MDTTNILFWYTGKSLEKAKLALDLLTQSEALGCWIPGASRKVRAALGKFNVAAKFARANGDILQSLGRDDGLRFGSGYTLSSAMVYGVLNRLEDVNVDEMRQTATTPEAKSVFETAERFVRDFAPVAEVMERLDATRPKPVFTSIGVSPTLTATLTDLGVAGASLDTIRPCPMEHVLVEKIHPKTGKKYFEYDTRLLWPPNTVHGASRYDRTHNNLQCQACGHAIKNGYNWVPLLVDVAGVPHSLWVGRDCAKSLFGIDMKGELAIEKK